MPSSRSCFSLNGVSVSQIQKFLASSFPSQSFGDKSMIDNLIQSLKQNASQGHLSKTFELFSLIRLYACSFTALHTITLFPLSSLLQCCAHLKSLPQGKQLHAHIISSGLEQHPILVPKLVTLYTSFNLLRDAKIVVQNSNVLDPLPWNLLISSYVRNELYGEVLSCYKMMKSKGVLPDNFTYPAVLKSCGEMGEQTLGREVHKSVVASPLDWNLYVHNAVLSMYGKFGEVEVAHRYFDKMPERDIVSWNTMISCYVAIGMWQEAFKLFENMHAEGIESNIVTCNTVAGAFLSIGKFKEVLDLVSRMRTLGNQVDAVAMLIGLAACSQVGAIKLGKEIHGVAIRSYYDRFENVGNSLITMYARCADLGHAYMLFQLTKSKSITTWNSMISSFASVDRPEEASFLLREMLLSGTEPNYVTIASILPLCARVANLKHGKEFHGYITRREHFKDCVILSNALIETYARSGKVVEARRLFDLMSKRDAVTYTSLIAGYGMQGEGSAALKLFDEMTKLEIKPDHVTMIAVLSSCSHSGLVKEGKKLFETMQCVYGIIPRLEHYSCIVDLYGRAGMLNKATEIIKRMPYMPSSAMWATLLGACRIHGNTEIGEWAAEKLLEMRPKNPGYYVLIANMYAAAGSWIKLAKVRTVIRDLGVSKPPGRAWVDVGPGFFSFVVEDASNPQAPEIYPMLDGLTELLKDAGYTVNTDSSSEYELLEEMG